LGSYSYSVFLIDKRGQTVFFPWRKGGKGYIVPDVETRRRLNVLLSGFNWISIILGFLVIISPSFLLSIQGGNLLCIGTFIGVPVNWLVLYFLIVEAITKRLSVYPLSYKDIILDNISSDDEDDSEV
jgi:hypothetical protein